MRRVELIGTDPGAVAILASNGIKSIDALADIDPQSDAAQCSRRSAGFNVDLGDLVVRAKARRSTLTEHSVKEWSVMARPNPGMGQLPVYQSGADPRLVRIYLDVEYDYIEDRLVGLAAHVTTAHRHWSPGTDRAGKKNQPDPVVVEGDPKNGEYWQLVGREIVSFIGDPWTGDRERDDEKEHGMLQGFFDDLAEAIVHVADNDQDRPVHFYVWSKNDMNHLIDSCTRAGGSLLHSLTELLGCRERCQGPMEQLIFTPLRDEIDQKVVLGYTGHSLAIAVSLGWFGFPRFHWTRLVDGEAVDLSRSFRRDIFDFRTSSI